MTGRRTIVGLCMLCALVFSAFAAQSASAASTTAVTCKAVGSGAQFSDAHCKTAQAGGAGFEHVAFTGNTELSGSNETTGGAKETTKLKSTISGVEVELQATTVGGSGTVTNSEEGGEMIASGTGTINYSGVTVTKPAGKGCVVRTSEGGELEKVNTNNLAASTKGLTNALKFSPAAGEVFASFWIEGCSVAELNGNYEVKGTIISTSITGATTNFTHANTTTQNTLKLRGAKAGIEGLLTLTGRLNSTQSFTALSVT